MDRTLSKGLTLLEALALSRRPRGVTDLGRELGLVKSNVHRLLKTLEHHRFVRKDPGSGGYECTLKLWELGSLLAERIDVKRVAAPCMAALAERTRETVHLSILDGGHVLYVDKIDSPQPVGAYSRVGGRAPAHCVATGKALLAHQPDAVIEDVAAGAARFTPQTLVARGAIADELARIREQGYAINRGEWRETVCGLAAPIFSVGPVPVAAIGISGPAERLPASVLHKMAPLVTQSARAISRELGASDLSVHPLKLRA